MCLGSRQYKSSRSIRICLLVHYLNERSNQVKLATRNPNSISHGRGEVNAKVLQLTPISLLLTRSNADSDGKSLACTYHRTVHASYALTERFFACH